MVQRAIDSLGKEVTGGVTMLVRGKKGRGGKLPCWSMSSERASPWWGRRRREGVEGDGPRREPEGGEGRNEPKSAFPFMNSLFYFP